MSTKKIGTVFNHPEDFRRYRDNAEFVLNSHIGVEVELEGFKKFPAFDTNAPQYWSVKEDGSLRAYDNLRPFEFVSAYYYCGEDLHEALNQLHNFLVGTHPTPNPSARTSVHVHVDVRDLSLKQLYDLVLVYSLYERALFRVVGIQRENSIFCVPLYKAANLLIRLSASGLTDQLASLPDENYRYSAFNFHAIKKFGSVEFRHHPGTLDMNKVRLWINILLSLKKYVLENAINTRSVLQQDVTQLTRTVFGSYSRYILSSMFNDDIKLGKSTCAFIIARDSIQNYSHSITNSMHDHSFSMPPSNKALKEYGMRHKLFNTKGSATHRLDTITLSISNGTPIFDEVQEN